MNNKLGFGGEHLGKEFDLVSLAWPYNERFQKSAALVMAESLIGKKGGRILDLGAGTGLTALPLLGMISKSHHVIELEAQPIMLDQARLKLRDYSEQTEYILDDALNALSPMPSNSLDGVISGFFFHNLPKDQRASLWELLSDRLRPGAMISACDKVVPDNLDLHRLLVQEQIKTFDVFAEHGHPELQREWAEHTHQDDLDPVTESELREMMRYGFTDLQIFERELVDIRFSCRLPQSHEM